MSEESCLFMEDVVDKKRTARGSRNRKSTRGRSGAVHFPSDYMTKKELNAMNGAVKSYRINCPMNWAEYKCLPDDLRIAYIRGLRRTYGAKDSTIFDMLGVSRSTGCLEVKRLGISPGKTAGIKFDREGWEKWLGRGEDETEAEEPVIDEPEAEEPVIDELPSAKIVSFSEQDWITLHLNLGMLNGYALVCDQHVGDRIRAITQAILEMLN